MSSLMDDPDLEDSVHDAPNLRDRSPRVVILVVQPVEPLLDFKRFDVLGNLTAPFRDKNVANVVLKDGLGVLRLWTGCDLIRPTMVLTTNPPPRRQL
jgi:hypothetical protein